MELSAKYDEIQTQIESEDSDFASVSDRVQTEDDLCNIECKLQNLLDHAEEMSKKILNQSKVRLLFNYNQLNYPASQIT